MRVVWIRSLVEMDAGERITTAASAIDSPDACEIALEQVTRPIHGLVHLAGVFLVDDLDAASRPIWNDVIAANLTNAFDMAAACRPRLEPEGESRMIFVSSVAFRRGSFDHIAYTAAKGGIVGLVRALSKKLGPKTLVNGLAPGIIETRMPEHLLAEERRRKVLIAETALKRFGPAARDRKRDPVPARPRLQLHHRPGHQCRRRCRQQLTLQLPKTQPQEKRPSQSPRAFLKYGRPRLAA